ncbi:MAG: hypothetical protein M1831_006568 [Alyxoria varia]|nr:MAG: hypothetical protein M1831_006568 [Alyxoria varia]
MPPTGAATTPSTLNNSQTASLQTHAQALYAASRTHAPVLKREEEIARESACYAIAARRLSQAGRLKTANLGEHRPPCGPRVFKKLVAYLEGVLENVGVGVEQPGLSPSKKTPRKRRTVDRIQGASSLNTPESTPASRNNSLQIDDALPVRVWDEDEWREAYAQTPLKSPATKIALLSPTATPKHPEFSAEPPPSLDLNDVQTPSKKRKAPELSEEEDELLLDHNTKRPKLQGSHQSQADPISNISAHSIPDFHSLKSITPPWIMPTAQTLCARFKGPIHAPETIRYTVGAILHEQELHQALHKIRLGKQQRRSGADMLALASDRSGTESDCTRLGKAPASTTEPNTAILPTHLRPANSHPTIFVAVLALVLSQTKSTTPEGTVPSTTTAPKQKTQNITTLDAQRRHEKCRSIIRSATQELAARKKQTGVTGLAFGEVVKDAEGLCEDMGDVWGALAACVKSKAETSSAEKGREYAVVEKELGCDVGAADKRRNERAGSGEPPLMEGDTVVLAGTVAPDNSKKDLKQLITSSNSPSDSPQQNNLTTIRNTDTSTRSTNPLKTAPSEEQPHPPQPTHSNLATPPAASSPQPHTKPVVIIPPRSTTIDPTKPTTTTNRAEATSKTPAAASKRRNSARATLFGATDWLAPARRREYKKWRCGILARVEEMGLA